MGNCGEWLRSSWLMRLNCTSFCAGLFGEHATVDSCGECEYFVVCVRAWFIEEDVLDAMLLKSVDDWPLASPNLEEETTLLGKPQVTHVVATHPPRCQKKALEPKNAAKLMEALTEPKHTSVSATTRI